MNADAPASGLMGLLKSLNCDRAYALALLGVCAMLALVEAGGDPVRQALSYDRAGLANGEWWRALTAHFVHLDAAHAALNSMGVVLMWALFARDYSPLRWLAIYLFSCLCISAGLWLWDPGHELRRRLRRVARRHDRGDARTSPAPRSRWLDSRDLHRREARV